MIVVVISLSGVQLCLSHPRISVFVHNFISIMIIIIHLQTNLANVSIIKLYPASAANYTDETGKFCGDLKMHSLKQQAFFPLIIKTEKKASNS